MKISIGSKIVDGPWGGGNLFVKNLSNYLINKGHKVIYDLSEPDINLILLTDPRSKRESSSTFNHIDINRYKKLVNSNVSVVQRINECDERKYTDYINRYYLEATNSADKVVFVSNWLEQIYLNLGLSSKKSKVILAGADLNIFNDTDSKTNIVNNEISIVTHHWSSHENKGFDIYQKLDELVKSPFNNFKLTFTYIGNTNQNYNLPNTKKISPLAGKELADELKKHHIYITGSINEPSGNHHIEAAQCGLPILYRDSGGMPEYCNGFGVSFDEGNFEERLSNIIKDYEIYKSKLKKYPFNSNQMCDEFYYLFDDLVSKQNNSFKKNRISLKGKLFLYKNRLILIFRKYFSNNLRMINQKLKELVYKK